MDKKYITLKENIYEDLFKGVVISGNYPLQKLNDMKDYIDALIIECQDLENINEKLSLALKSAEDKLDKIDNLYKENEQLKDKFDKLKKYIKKDINSRNYNKVVEEILIKIQELEQGSDK